MKFEELDLSYNILDALDDMHFDTCTPIQEKCIPEILSGNDVIGIAQTGTGKTAAYLLPILSLLDEQDFKDDAINCIIMSPTRELAQQIDQAMQGFSYYLDNVNSLAVYGGNDGSRFENEKRGLTLGADVIIATPGRFLSHIQMGNVDLSNVSFFVLDEADRMLDMGFSDDILKIASLLPRKRQTVMFSATMPEKIEKLARNLMYKPVEVKLSVSKPAEKIKQLAFMCYDNQKIGVLKYIFKTNDLKKTIIFASSKVKVSNIQRTLSQLRVKSGEMHSDLTQQQRDNVMYDFKAGNIDILVATDIVSRGIDIDNISAVINYDVPHDVEDYVHRIGRTARADRDGMAITLINDKDIDKFINIEKFLKYKIEKGELPNELGETPVYRSATKNKRRKTKYRKFVRRKKTN